MNLDPTRYMDHRAKMAARELRPDTARVKVRVHFRTIDKPRTLAPIPQQWVAWSEDPAGQVVVSGQCIKAGPDGTAEAVIYADELPRLEALVETETDLLDRARHVYRRDMRKAILEGYERDLRPAELPEDPATWPHEAQTIAVTYGGSVEGEFFKLADRGLLPFQKVEVLEELPAPEHPEQTFARTLASAQGMGGGGLSKEEIIAMGQAIGEAIAANMNPKGKSK